MAQNNQSPSSNDTLLGAFALIALAILIIWVLNKYFGSNIRDILIGYRSAQLSIFSFLSGDAERWLKAVRYHQQRRPMDWSDVMAISITATAYLKYPVGILCLWCAWWTMTKSPRTKYRRRYTLETLIEAQAKVWRVITPITRVNPSKSARPPNSVPDRLDGTWAQAMTPNEFCYYHKIMGDAGMPDPVGARAAFTAQLGAEWKGIAVAPPYVRALVAALFLFVQRERAQARELMGDLAVGWRPGKGLVLDEELSKKIAGILSSDAAASEIQKMEKLHGAWTNAFMVGFLHYARRRAGIIQPALFTWLRPVDRNLWYALQQLPPPSTKLKSKLVEGAGSLAHYEAEVVLGKASREPLVDAAVAALLEEFTAE